MLTYKLKFYLTYILKVIVQWNRAREFFFPPFPFNLYFPKAKTLWRKSVKTVGLDELIFGFCLQRRGITRADRASDGNLSGHTPQLMILIWCSDLYNPGSETHACWVFKRSYKSWIDGSFWVALFLNRVKSLSWQISFRLIYYIAGKTNECMKLLSLSSNHYPHEAFIKSMHGDWMSH